MCWSVRDPREATTLTDCRVRSSVAQFVLYIEAPRCMGAQSSGTQADRKLVDDPVRCHSARHRHSIVDPVVDCSILATRLEQPTGFQGCVCVCVDHARVAQQCQRTHRAHSRREKALRTILRVGLLNLTNPALRFLGSKMARLTGGDGSRDTKRQSRESARALVGSQSASLAAELFTSDLT